MINLLVSIVIPAYNAEDFIIRTLDSLEQQSFKEFEIVVVDDGSKDKTLSTLIDYKNQSTMNLNIISQTNQGVSSARNNGLLNSNGRYITFIDSDDYVSCDYLGKMVNELVRSKKDVVLCGFDIVTTDKILLRKYNDRYKYALPDNESRKALYKYITGDIYLRAGNFIVKKTILTDNDIKFPVNVKYGEDQEVFMKMLYYAKDVAYIEESLYFYVDRPSSVMNVYANVHYAGLLRSIKNCIDLFEKQPFVDKKLVNLLKCFKLPKTINFILSDWAKTGAKDFYLSLVQRKIIRYYLIQSLYLLNRPSISNIKIIIKSITLLILPNLFYKHARKK